MKELYDEYYRLTPEKLEMYMIKREDEEPLSSESIDEVVTTVNEIVYKLVNKAFEHTQDLMIRGPISFQNFRDDYWPAYDQILVESLFNRKFSDDGWDEDKIEELLDTEVYGIEDERQYILLGILDTLVELNFDLNDNHDYYMNIRDLLLIWAIESFSEYAEEVGRTSQRTYILNYLGPATLRIGMIGLTPIEVNYYLINNYTNEKENDKHIDGFICHLYNTIIELLVDLDYSKISDPCKSMLSVIINNIAYSIAIFIDDNNEDKKSIEEMINDLNSDICNRSLHAIYKFFSNDKYDYCEALYYLMEETLQKAESLKCDITSDPSFLIHHYISQSKYHRDRHYLGKVHRVNFPLVIRPCESKDEKSLIELIHEKDPRYSVDQIKRNAMIASKIGYIIETIKIASDVIHSCNIEEFNDAVTKVKNYINPNDFA